VAPKYLRRGKGCRVWDVDGNEYLDFNMAIGPLALGYAYPAVDEAIRAHDGEGAVARDRYVGLTPTYQKYLLDFLNSN